MWCFGEGMGWWSWLGGTGMIILWAGLIALVIWGTISLTRRNQNNPGDKALDIVKERYAKGEITEEEYYKYKNNI